VAAEEQEEPLGWEEGRVAGRVDGGTEEVRGGVCEEERGREEWVWRGKS